MDPGSVRLMGAVDPSPEASPARDWLISRRIPLFPDMESFYRAGCRADLVVIASPIAEHAPQAGCALEHGSHVLCEKPLAATVQDVDELIRIRDAAGKQLHVGYQWSYSHAVRALKSDLLAGRWGRPLRARTLCLWPRSGEYYSRNTWAGRRRDPAGRWVLDSPAQNAMAHFLHNLFFLLGEEMNGSARPVEAEGELYRVYPIDNADSVAGRMMTERGVECLFFASHAVSRPFGPKFMLECEKGKIAFGEGEDVISGVDSRRRIFRYGSPGETAQFEKFHVALAAARGKGEVMCGPEAARAQTLCVNGLQESAGRPVRLMGNPKADLPVSGKESGREAGGERIWKNKLAQAFEAGYRAGRLPSEMGVRWARKGRRVDLRRYDFFPGGAAPKRGGREENAP